MAVTKVIVDELPYGCEVCRWMTYDGYCDLVEKALPEISDERPDWCPLVAGKIIPTIRKGYLLIKESDPQ